MTDSARSGPAVPETDRPDPTAVPSTIVVLNRDLMFGVRIANVARELGHAVVFARDAAGFADLVRTTEPAPVLGIIDMNAGIDWCIVRALVDDPGVATPLLAFGPHLDVANRRAAKAAGVHRMVTNGEFHRDMIGLVRRYARPVLDDE